MAIVNGFNFDAYDIGGNNAKKGDGRLTGDEIKKARADGWNVWDGYSKDISSAPSKLKKDTGETVSLGKKTIKTSDLWNDIVCKADKNKAYWELFAKNIHKKGVKSVGERRLEAFGLRNNSNSLLYQDDYNNRASLQDKNYAKILQETKRETDKEFGV